MTRGLPAVAVTFDRHPREVFAPGTEPRQLTSPARKAELIEALGVDTLLVLEFTEEFCRVPADEFAKQILADGLHAEHVVVGDNFTFGHRRWGTSRPWSTWARTLGFGAEGVPLLEIDGRPCPRRPSGRRWSTATSTGRGWRSGAATPSTGGSARAPGAERTLGWPTANLDLPPKMLLPGKGVYAGRATLPRGTVDAAINVGTNPTFGVEPLHLEAFLLDFDGDIRGEEMTVEFWERVSA